LLLCHVKDEKLNKEQEKVTIKKGFERLQAKLEPVEQLFMFVVIANVTELYAKDSSFADAENYQGYHYKVLAEHVLRKLFVVFSVGLS
jgi:small nuclear ribonucleoprotein (snRNP)-like protein